MKARKTLLVVVLTGLLCVGLWGQEGQVDSLEQLLANGEFSATRKAEVLLQLSKAYEHSNPQKGMKKAQAALQLLDEKEEPKHYVKTLNTLGALSVKLGDSKSAKDYYNKAYRSAFERDVSFEQKVDAIKGKGTVAAYIGDNESALASYNEGLSICDSLGLLEQKADLLTNKSIALQNQGKYEEALKLQKATLRLKQEPRFSTLELGKSYLGIANTFARNGQNDSASVYASRALSSFRDHGDQYGIATSFSTKGNIARGLGKLQEAVSCFDSARTYYQRIGNEQHVAISGMQAGSVMNIMQLSDKAAKYLKESLAILKRGGNKRALLFAYQTYADALSGSIDGQEGPSARETRDTIIQVYLKAVAIAEDLGNPYNEGLALSNLGQNYFLIGDYSEAIPVLRRGIALRNDEGLYHPYLTLAECYIATGMRQRAKQALLTSDSLAQQIKGLTNTAEYYNELAIAYQKLGMHAQSNDALFRYIEIRNEYYDESKASAIAEIEERYQTKKKELRNQALQRKNELKTMGLAGLLAGLVLVGVIAYFFYKQKQELRVTNAKINLLHRELSHRVKNNLAFVSSLMRMQGRRLESAEAQQAVKESEARVEAMSLLHRKLYLKEDTDVDVSNYLQELCAYLQDAFPTDARRPEIEVKAAPILINGEDVMRIGLIVNELVTNTYKYAFDEPLEPKINIQLSAKTGGGYQLRYQDNGQGLPAEVNVEEGGSMGLKLIHTLTRQLDGSMEQYNEGGACFHFDFAERKIA